MLSRIVFAVALIAAACAVQAQMSPPLPLPQTPGGIRRIPIPPSKGPGVSVTVNGPVNLAAVYTSSLVASVAFFIDGKQIGSVKQKPYALDWYPPSAVSGQHIAKWTALDSGGKELASGSVTLILPQAKVTPPLTSGFVVYSNEKLGIILEHPEGWGVRREFKDLPKEWADAYWLILSTEPASKALNVVNLRHYMDPAEQVAEEFARKNPFVQPWQRMQIGGHSSFFTTGGLASSKRVVHRAIILIGRHVMMLNLIDSSGKPPTESKDMFLRIAGSIAVQQPTGQGR